MDYSGLLREMDGLEGQATFENVESTFPVAGFIRRGSVEAPKALAKDGNSNLIRCAVRMDEEKDGLAHGDL